MNPKQLLESYKKRIFEALKSKLSTKQQEHLLTQSPQSEQNIIFKNIKHHPTKQRIKAYITLRNAEDQLDPIDHKNISDNVQTSMDKLESAVTCLIDGKREGEYNGELTNLTTQLNDVFLPAFIKLQPNKKPNTDKPLLESGSLEVESKHNSASNKSDVMISIQQLADEAASQPSFLSRHKGKLGLACIGTLCIVTGAYIAPPLLYFGLTLVGAAGGLTVIDAGKSSQSPSSLISTTEKMKEPKIESESKSTSEQNTTSTYKLLATNDKLNITITPPSPPTTETTTNNSNNNNTVDPKTQPLLTAEHSDQSNNNSNIKTPTFS